MPAKYSIESFDVGSAATVLLQPNLPREGNLLSVTVAMGSTTSQAPVLIAIYLGTRDVRNVFHQVAQGWIRGVSPSSTATGQDEGVSWMGRWPLSGPDRPSFAVFCRNESGATVSTVTVSWVVET